MHFPQLMSDSVPLAHLLLVTGSTCLLPDQMYLPLIACYIGVCIRADGVICAYVPLPDCGISGCLVATYHMRQSSIRVCLGSVCVHTVTAACCHGVLFRPVVCCPDSVAETLYANAGPRRQNGVQAKQDWLVCVW
jgi:hypothetical protein